MGTALDQFQHQRCQALDNKIKSMPISISNIANYNLAGASNSTPALDFTLSYPDNPDANFTITGTSSDTSLILDANIVFGGSGLNRTVTVTAPTLQKGTALITISVVTPGETAVTTSFILTLNRESVYTDTYIDWTTIAGPVDSYLYINFKPGMFSGGGAVDFENYKQKLLPITSVYNGKLQAQDIIESFLIVTQVGADGVNTSQFTQSNPYGTGRKPWRVEIIPVTDPNLTINLQYESRMKTVSNEPKNVGRYDITIDATYTRDLPTSTTTPPTHAHNGTYKCFWSSYKDKPNDEDFIEQGSFLALATASNRPGVETRLYDKFNLSQAPHQGYGNTFKYLLIVPRPVIFTLTKTEFVYSGNTNSPEFTADTEILDTADPYYPGPLPVTLLYSKANSNSPELISPLAAPIEIGSYIVNIEVSDLNYSGLISSPLNVVPVTPTSAAAEAAEYQGKIDLFNSSPRSDIDGVASRSTLSSSAYASYSQRMTRDEFVQSGILAIIGDKQIEGLNKIQTLAECAKNLPQKLMVYAAAKIAAFIFSYIPGAGILGLITSVMQVIEQVKKILALIEFIKDNPWAFLDQVLKASGAYAAIGSVANEALSSISEQFPGISAGVGDVAGFIKDVANGVVDICNNVDINGNPIANLIKADNTKVPTAILGFDPITIRQPVEAKAKYDLFQFRLRGALYKDGDRIRSMTEDGNLAGVQEYVSMLTAVHELAYNYHDRIASTGSGSGSLLDGNASSAGSIFDSTYNVLGSAANILSGVTRQTTTTTSGGSKKTLFSVDSLNSSLSSAANTISGVGAGIGAVGSFLSGENRYSLSAFKNEFNFSARETLNRNQNWSSSTVAEYTERVNRIKYEMENNADVIKNNPANKKVITSGQIQNTTSGPAQAATPSGSSPLMQFYNSKTVIPAAKSLY